MRVVVNGRDEQLADGATVAVLADHLAVPERGAAVAVDAEVVPRSAWERTVLHEGARVEVVHAVQGG